MMAPLFTICLKKDSKDNIVNPQWAQMSKGERRKSIKLLKIARRRDHCVERHASSM